VRKVLSKPLKDKRKVLSKQSKDKHKVLSKPSKDKRKVLLKSAIVNRTAEVNQRSQVEIYRTE